MELYFKICKYDTCGISITGMEKDNKQYSNGMTSDTYRYIDTVSLNVLVPVTKDGKDELPYDLYEIVEHTLDEDKSIFIFPKDGLFKVIHAIIPTKAWWDIYKQKYNHYDYVYYYDSGKFYEVKNGITEEITLLDVIVAGDINGKCTIFKGVQYTFNICNTEQCLYSFSQDFLNKMCSDKCSAYEDVKNRDLIFMTVHILKYLIDLGRYFEALELIEKIHGCTGICKLIKNKISNSGGCGCTS